MRDNFKDLVENSREDFEVYPFDSKSGWDEISGQVANKRKSNRLWILMGVAASFALLISVGFFLYKPASNSAGSELAELEMFYAGEIDQRISLIKNHIKDDRVLADLEEMNEAFAELKSDLNDNVDNEEVVVAMMENYRLKLQILEEILRQIEEEKDEEVL